ncbi:hypothetical protein Hanom_Chr01g00000341 [Helianthus anomalus]
MLPTNSLGESHLKHCTRSPKLCALQSHTGHKTSLQSSTLAD